MIEKDRYEAVDVNFMKAGMLLSGVLFNEDGAMLWPAQKALTEYFIINLKKRAVKYAYYMPPRYKEVKYKEPVISEENLKSAYNAVEEIAGRIAYGKIPDVNTAKKVVEGFHQEIESKPEGFLNLMSLKEYDTYTFSHSINVGILSMFLTLRLGYNNVFVKEAGLGGMLHDIGKLKISSKIVNKPDYLTLEEFKIMKFHPIYGFNLIRNDQSVSNFIKKMVLFHHEKWDGTGYPTGVKSESIGNFASIVAVSDVYDALTTERPYKKPMSVNDALLYIMRGTLTHFNPYVSQRFIIETARMYELGSFYPVNSYVLLNTGETAVVLKLDHEYSMRPEVALLKNFNGLPLRAPINIDLKQDSSRTIAKTIDDPDELEILSRLL